MNTNSNQKTLNQRNPIKVFIISLIVATIIFYLIFFLSGDFKSGKPSVCDCNTVMSYGNGSVEAADRILDYDAGENFMSASQRQCGLKYWDEIKEWQTIKSKQLGFNLQGTPVDNAMEFFNEKCNSK